MKYFMYQGLIALVRDYLRGQDDVEADTMCTLSNYWQLLSQRASGKLKTNARWIRDFLRSHSSYKQDSVVSEEAVYDLMVAIDQIQKGERKEPSLFVKAEKKSKSTEVKQKWFQCHYGILLALKEALFVCLFVEQIINFQLQKYFQHFAQIEDRLNVKGALTQ